MTFQKNNCVSQFVILSILALILLITIYLVFNSFLSLTFFPTSSVSILFNLIFLSSFVPLLLIAIFLCFIHFLILFVISSLLILLHFFLIYFLFLFFYFYFLKFYLLIFNLIHSILSHSVAAQRFKPGEPENVNEAVHFGVVDGFRGGAKHGFC
jgi:hypothetical protein